MKNLNTYLNEGFFKNVGAARPQPKTKKELIECINDIYPNMDLNIIDTSKISDMSSLFEKTKFKDAKYNFDVSSWNVSNVKNMNYMFDGCENFNSDLSKWDVSNVKCMQYMFYECKNFNSDLSKWDVSNVKDVSYMFYGCENFNSDLSKWDVSNMKYMKCIFYGCKNFNSDLSKWNVSNVKNMAAMFDECNALKKSKLIPGWYK